MWTNDWMDTKWVISAGGTKWLQMTRCWCSLLLDSIGRDLQLGSVTSALRFWLGKYVGST